MTIHDYGEDHIVDLIRNTIMTASVDEPDREPITLQQVLESGILAEVSDPDAVMQRIADRLARQIAARLRDRMSAESDASSPLWRIEITPESMSQALEAFGFWGATDAQIMAILGAGLHGRLLGWRRGVGVDDALHDPDNSARLRAMTVVIHHLGRRFSAPEDVLAWMRSPNRGFGGQSPLEHMSSGRLEDLEGVRALLRHRGEPDEEQP